MDLTENGHENGNVKVFKISFFLVVSVVFKRDNFNISNTILSF